jgi:hypothetical protein
MNLRPFSSCQHFFKVQSADLRIPADYCSYKDPATKRPIMHFPVCMVSSRILRTIPVTIPEASISIDRWRFDLSSAVLDFILCRQTDW